LDVTEYERMKTHALLGADMLKFSQRDLFSTAAVIASQHHERWDGQGYPAGLAGENIHILARITAIADVFDALTNDRVYRVAWSVEESVDYLRTNAGTQFDPALIGIFLENLPSFLDIIKRLP